ncbi:plasmalemma vesicle-associated protein [Choloepus didactylus]|uniref:plasmalemma vesicle-associated protein n=1 Tax=Choloepus didactylus TaxID=27675 RepID=UPI00189D617D|nr:plasmalemma vesicle-associated protein [Choloepus didactylus]
MGLERNGPYAQGLGKSGGSPRGCWYYLRYFFLFVSLIQLLIILGLVLFMVYGNAHVGTESSLQATERRAESLYGQVVGLSASQTNLTKELNLTARAKEAIMQMLLGARRDLDRINASFRQCQGDRVIYQNNQRFMAAIILSEKQCQQQLKETNKSCDTMLLLLGQKAKTLELELAKEKATCAKDKETLALSKHVAGEQLAECGKTREQQRQERQLAEDRLQKVQALCLPLDKEKIESDLRNLWRDSIIPRTLDALSYSPYHPLGADVASVRRSCDHMPTLMSTKVEELARSLRAGIERVARENSDLQRQKLEAEQGLRSSQEAREKAEKEAQGREAKLQGECARQTQLALEEKAALRKERDNLAKELEDRKREVEHLKMQLAVSNSALDTCIRAKSQPLPLPRPVGPAPNPPPIDPASLEEFKRRILESQHLPASNVAVSPLSG